ncbi:hypothetical protein BJV74DRAFT_865230, partial [Russula compacta]
MPNFYPYPANNAPLVTELDPNPNPNPKGHRLRFSTPPSRAHVASPSSSIPS